MIMRARVLLALDTSGDVVDPNEVIAARVGVSGETLRLVAKRFAETGGDIWATISRKQRELPPVPSPVTGEVEARLIALACSQPRAGYARWSLRLLENTSRSSPTSRTWTTPPSAGFSKNGIASSSEEVLDHLTTGERGVRGPHGRHPRRLRPPSRPKGHCVVVR